MNGSSRHHAAVEAQPSAEAAAASASAAEEELAEQAEAKIVNLESVAKAAADALTAARIEALCRAEETQKGAGGVRGCRLLLSFVVVVCCCRWCSLVFVGVRWCSLVFVVFIASSARS